MNFKTDWKVGLFIICSFLILGILAFTIGKPGSFLSDRQILKVLIAGAEGLNVGSDVRVHGLQSGVVLGIDFGDETGRVLVTFSVVKKALPRIKVDSRIEILSLGLLGDKYISIVGGTKEAAQINPNEIINNQLTGTIEKSASPTAVIENVHAVTEQLRQIFERINKSGGLDQSLASVKGASDELNQLLNQFNKTTTPKIGTSAASLDSILKKIDSGEGTLGALVNDPTVYEQLKSILGGVERNKVLKYVIRNNIKRNEDDKEAKEEDQKQKSSR